MGTQCQKKKNDESLILQCHCCGKQLWKLLIGTDSNYSSIIKTMDKKQRKHKKSCKKQPKKKNK